MEEYKGEIKHPKFKGPATSRQQKRSKERRGNVDKSKMNKGGFYENMPGCHLTPEGNRRMIQFIVTPEGKSQAEIYAHPILCKQAIENALYNPMIKGVMYAAVTDHMFKNKTIWNLPFRLRYKFIAWWTTRKMEKKRMQSIKNQISDENTEGQTEQNQNQSEQSANNQG